MTDEINRPSHYTWLPNVEVNEILVPLCETSGWNITNAVKYLLRADFGKGSPEKDFRKAIHYIQRELDRRDSKRTSDRCTVSRTILNGDRMFVSSTLQCDASKDCSGSCKQTND